MRQLKTTFVLRLVAAGIITFLPSGKAFADPPKLRLLIIGDSTAASYSKPPPDRPTLTGWGQVFSQFLDGRVQVLNHARSGRSSKSFQREGLWEKALAKQPDFILIQFGHNDCPGKGERSTDPKTDFRDYLRDYVDDARRIGATPILVTPMTRRNFRDGRIHSTLRPYAEAMIAVAQEKKIPVVDLHRESVRLFNQLGDSGSANLSASARDRTHFSRRGALVIARIIAEQLPQAEPQLKPYLKDLQRPHDSQPK